MLWECGYCRFDISWNVTCFICTIFPSRDKQDKVSERISRGSDANHGSETAHLPKRTIRQEWFKKFPWLKIDENKQHFLCEICIKHNQVSIFTTGKPVGNPKKDNFTKHEETEGHKVGVLMERGLSLHAAKSSVFLNTSSSELPVGVTDDTPATASEPADIFTAEQEAQPSSSPHSAHYPQVSPRCITVTS